MKEKAVNLKEKAVNLKEKAVNLKEKAVNLDTLCCSGSGIVANKAHGEADQQIILDNLSCHGDERSIVECDHDPWGRHDCASSKAVSVWCGPLPSSKSPFYSHLKRTASSKMFEIDPSHVNEIEYKKAACGFRMFERSSLRQHRLFTFVRHYASREVSYGMLTKVCRARINYLKLSCFLHYLLTV